MYPVHDDILFSVRAVRQYGYRHLIPVEDTIPPKIYGLTWGGIRKSGKYWAKRPIWYTQKRLECKKVSKSYIVWILTQNPAIRK